MSNENVGDSVNAYRDHYNKRVTYIDKCAVVYSELEAMDRLAVQSIVEAYLQSIPITDFVREALKGSIADDCKELLCEIEMASYIDNIDHTDSDTYSDIVQPQSTSSASTSIVPSQSKG